LAEPKRLLILTRNRANAAFRQRIEPYVAPLAARGVACEVVELARCPWARRGQIRRGRAFDGVLLHRKTLTAWDAWAFRAAARRLIYDFDDAVMVQARSPDRPHAGRLRRFRRTMARADLVIAGNRILAEHAHAAGASHVEIVPTGLDVSRFAPKPMGAAERRVRLVWIGSASTLKQLEPFRPTFEALGQAVPGLVLRVIADADLHVPGLAVENVRWRLEDEARLLAESDVGIAPLPDTPFTRGKCGFKVLQYMAAGLPVVTSPVGVNAEYVRHGETGLWARGPEDWLGAVRQLAEDRALRERLGREGRRRAEREFDFGVLAPTVCAAIEQALR